MKCTLEHSACEAKRFVPSKLSLCAPQLQRQLYF